MDSSELWFRALTGKETRENDPIIPFTHKAQLKPMGRGSDDEATWFTSSKCSVIDTRQLGIITRTSRGRFA